jgi:uncharacterized protein
MEVYRGGGRSPTTERTRAGAIPQGDMTRHAPHAAPIPLAERMETLDVLRGFALLGITAINVQIFSGSPTVAFNLPLRVAAHVGAHPTADAIIMGLQWLVFEGKMRALFSILFGAGCMLILSKVNSDQESGRFADVFHRRNMWLMAFGLIHGVLIWAGDVLLLYASVALLTLYPLRHLSARRLVQFGLALALIGGTFGISNALGIKAALSTARLEINAQDALVRGSRPAPEEADAFAKAGVERRAQLKALASPSRATSSPGGVAANASGYLGFVVMIFTSGWILETVGLLIAGMGLLKSGYLTGHLHSSTYVTIAIVGYSVSVPIVLAGLLQANHYGFSSSVTAVWVALPYELQSISAALAHSATIILIVKHGRLKLVRRSLANVGRTAFTNYLMVSIVLQGLFPWFGVLPFAGMEHYQLLTLTICIWTLNVALSHFWLRSFAFGPLEWIWRSLTYWEAQPLASTSLLRPWPPRP